MIGQLRAGKIKVEPRLLRLFQRRDRLSSGVAGIQFVPEADLVFAHFPAEADIASFMSAGEVDKAHLVVLQIATDF